MSAITAVARALFNTIFQGWSNRSSPSISLLLYSNCCVVFLLVFYRRFDGYFHVLLKITANHIRTLKKKLIESDVAFNSIGLGSNAKDKNVCTVELDPGEVPSLHESEEEEERRRRGQQGQRRKRLGKEDRIEEDCSSRQRSNIQCEDTFEILIRNLSEYDEDGGSFDETLAFWRRKEMEEMISRRKLKC